MGTFNRQYASTPLPSDLNCINLKVVDIPPFSVIVADTTPADLIPTQDGFAVVLPTTGGTPGVGCGVTMETVKAGGTAARYRTQGLVPVTCDGAVLVGTYVDVSTVTAGRVKAHAAGQPSFAYAMMTGADGDQIIVDLSKGNAPNA